MFVRKAFVPLRVQVETSLVTKRLVLYSIRSNQVVPSGKTCATNDGNGWLPCCCGSALSEKSNHVFWPAIVPSGLASRTIEGVRLKEFDMDKTFFKKCCIRAFEKSVAVKPEIFVVDRVAYCLVSQWNELRWSNPFVSNV